MPTLSIVIDPTLERAGQQANKLLDTIPRTALKTFAKESGITDSEQGFKLWLDHLSQNSLFVLTLDDKKRILGLITALNNQERVGSEFAEIEPLYLTAFYSHPRDYDNEAAMMEVMVEVAVLHGHKLLKIPNTTKIFREFVDKSMVNPVFRDIEAVLSPEDIEHDTFDLSEYKTYKSHSA